MSDRRSYVLVIEDDESLRMAIEMILEEAGINVITAQNGREGLARFTEIRPQLILLDMRMPVMDGWEFARELYSRHGHSVPIVVISAAEDVKKRAKEVDADGYLGKPFQIDVLVQMVRRFLPPRIDSTLEAI